MRNIPIMPFLLFLFGCVPYNKQVQTLHSRILESSKPSEILRNETLFQTQLDFENWKIENGEEITLMRVLPKFNDLPKSEAIIIFEDNLLIPIEYHPIQRRGSNTYRIKTAEYYLVWDGKTYINDQSELSIDLIFVESTNNETNKRIPSKGPLLVDATTGGIVGVGKIIPPGISYLSFNLRELQDDNSKKIGINLLGLPEELEYKYR